MSPLVLILILLIIFGGAGFRYGGPIGGSGGLGLALFILLVLYVVGYL